MSDIPFILTPHYPQNKVALKIYSPKKRKTLPARFEETKWPEIGHIGLTQLPISLRSHSDVKGPDKYNRYYILRNEIIKDEWQEYAPFLAKKLFVPLHVDMIPSSSWGASLSNLLEKENWQALRKAVYKNAGYICEICGASDGTPLECHELWNFKDDKADENGWYTQTLEKMISLCHCCHEMFHPGLANINGRSDICIARRCAINAWTLKDYETAEYMMNNKFKKRSSKKWKLDFNILSENTVLKIKSSWKIVKNENDTFLRNEAKGSFTKIIGVNYIISD